MAVTTTTSSSTQIPAFLQSRLESLLGRAEGVSQQGYTPYGGPRVAATTPDQAAAQALARTNMGSYQPMVDKAREMYTSAGTYDPNAVEQFRNPYRTNVAEQIATMGNRNLTENVLPQINNTFTGAGQFGSRRNYDFTGRAIRDNQQAISDAQGKALFDAENAAQANYGEAQARTGNAAAGIGNLVGTQQKAQAGDIDALNASGTAQQGQVQKNYDTAYQDYLTQQNYPKEQLNFLSGAIRGNPMPTASTTTNTGSSPSTASSLLNLAGLAGLSYAGLKKGGKPKKKPLAKRKKKAGM